MRSSIFEILICLLSIPSPPPTYTHMSIPHFLFPACFFCMTLGLGSLMKLLSRCQSALQSSTGFPEARGSDSSQDSSFLIWLADWCLMLARGLSSLLRRSLHGAVGVSSAHGSCLTPELVIQGAPRQSPHSYNLDFYDLKCPILSWDIMTQNHQGKTLSNFWPRESLR